MFSVLHRMTDPSDLVSFQLPDSEAGLEAPLEEGCLDGILEQQVRMVIDCQPFRSSPEGPVVEQFQTGLRLLLDWTLRLNRQGTRLPLPIQSSAPTSASHGDGAVPTGPSTGWRPCGRYEVNRLAGRPTYER
jgi:hypothetical protein